MKKKAFAALALVILIGLGALIGLRRSQAPTLSEGLNGTATTTLPSSIPTVTDSTIDEKSEAWTVFRKYVSAAEKHDLASLSSVAYQLTAACKDPARRTECDGLMDNAFNYGSGFREEDMTHLISDKKQLILVSDYVKNLEGEAPSVTRGVIYFVRQDGALKFLSFKPFDGSFIIRTEGAATSTIEARLAEMVKDADGDTLPDEVELCKGDNVDPNCAKTNPKAKDSNGDGWWDSIEALFYK